MKVFKTMGLSGLHQVQQPSHTPGGMLPIFVLGAHQQTTKHVVLHQCRPKRI